MKSQKIFALAMTVVCTVVSTNVQIASASTQCGCGGTGRICSSCRGTGYYDIKCESCGGTGEKGSAQKAGEAIGNLVGLPFMIVGNVLGANVKTEVDNRCSKCNGKGAVRYACYHTNGFYECPECSQKRPRSEEPTSTSAASPEPQGQASKDVNIQDVIFNKRIEKFGGFYLGAEIRLPASCKNFGLPGYEGLLADWVEDSEYLKGAKYKYNKEDGTIMQQDMLSENVYRFVYVTPRTRLVCAVQLCYVVPSSKFARQKPLIEDFFRKEFSNSIGLPIFMNDGNVAVDKRSQIVNFKIKDFTDNGNSLRGSSVMVIDIRSYQTEAAEVDAQNAREQARINEQMAAEKARIDEENAKNQKQLQRWIEDFNSQPPFTSFCGIEFGTRLTGDLERTENGRYLCGYVELDTPSRGCDIAKVYAGVKTHRIFRVEIETKDRPGQLGAYDVGSGHIVGPGVLDKKYNPNNNPLINVNTYLATIEDYEFIRTKVMQERSRIEQMISRMEGSSSYLNYFGHLPSYYKLNGGMIDVGSRSVGTGDFYNTVEEHGNYALAITKEREKEVGVLIATSYKYKKIADEEYEKESGGDGSGVL